MSDFPNSNDAERRGNAPTSSGVSLNPIDVLNRAREAVPAVNYALALAGIAAAGAIVVGFVGHSKASIVLFGLLLVGMMLVFVFSRLVVSKSRSIHTAGLSLMWLVTSFFSFFLLFTVTAVVGGWPCNWADVLNLKSACGSSSPQVLVDGMMPADAADILNQQGNQVGGQMFRLTERLKQLRWDITQKGVNRVAPWVRGTGDQNDAEAVIAQTQIEANRLNDAFVAANRSVMAYLRSGKIEAAKQAQKEAQRLVDNYKKFCAEDVFFKLNDGSTRGVLAPVTEWSECLGLPPYGLEGLSITN